METDVVVTVQVGGGGSLARAIVGGWIREVKGFGDRLDGMVLQP